METVLLILLLVHLLAFGALFGGIVAQAGPGEKHVNGAMRDGVVVALLSGLAMVGVLQADDQDFDTAQAAVKAVIGLVLLVLVLINVRRESITRGLWTALLVLTVTNVGVAVL